MDTSQPIQIGKVNKSVLREARNSYRLLELKTDINTATIFVALALFAVVILFIIIVIQRKFKLQQLTTPTSEV